MKYFITHSISTVFMLLLTVATHAQSIKEQSYQAYLSGDLKQWQSIIENSSTTATINEPEKALELALVHYGITAQSLFRSDEKRFDKYVPLTHDILDDIMEEHEPWAEPLAISSFIMGFQIANSPMKGIYLGAKSMSRMNKALELNRQSPVVMQLYAGSKYFSPKFFGGDIQEAIKAYNQAIRLFEEQNRTNEWLYLDALAFLGKSYMRIGEVENAIAIYQKALTAEPLFSWVSNKLLPKAEETLNAPH